MQGNDNQNVSDQAAARKYVDALVIEMLSESEADLLERIASLEADVETYREIALVAITGLHAKNVEADRYQARILSLVSELKLAREDARFLGGQLRQWQELAA